MTRNEILKAAKRWRKEDEENRSFLVLLNEKTGEDEETAEYISSEGLCGRESNVLHLILNAMNNIEELRRVIICIVLSNFTERLAALYKKTTEEEKEEQDGK